MLTTSPVADLIFTSQPKEDVKSASRSISRQGGGIMSGGSDAETLKK
jgi:hypothetical protein